MELLGVHAPLRAHGITDVPKVLTIANVPSPAIVEMVEYGGEILLLKDDIQEPKCLLHDQKELLQPHHPLLPLQYPLIAMQPLQGNLPTMYLKNKVRQLLIRHESIPIRIIPEHIPHDVLDFVWGFIEDLSHEPDDFVGLELEILVLVEHGDEVEGACADHIAHEVLGGQVLDELGAAGLEGGGYGAGDYHFRGGGGGLGVTVRDVDLGWADVPEVLLQRPEVVLVADPSSPLRVDVIEQLSNVGLPGREVDKSKRIFQRPHKLPLIHNPLPSPRIEPLFMQPLYGHLATMQPQKEFHKIFKSHRLIEIVLIPQEVFGDV